MKRFVVILILLLIAGGCVFYFGWIQIHLPPETYALIFTKTGGYDSDVIKPGVFSWRWERLIPTNMTIYKFDLHPYSRQVSIYTELPSAELYSSVLPKQPEFAISGRISVSFALEPRTLPKLVSEEKLTPENLETYYERRAEQVTRDFLNLAMGSDLTLMPAKDWEQKLKIEIDEKYPLLNITDLAILEMSIPDFDLYRMAKNSYRSLLEIREEAAREAVAAAAREREKAEALKETRRATLDILSEYGELLNRYPVLLKALYVQKLGGKEGLEIPGLDFGSILQVPEESSE